MPCIPRPAAPSISSKTDAPMVSGTVKSSTQMSSTAVVSHRVRANELGASMYQGLRCARAWRRRPSRDRWAQTAPMGAALSSASANGRSSVGGSGPVS